MAFENMSIALPVVFYINILVTKPSRELKSLIRFLGSSVFCQFLQIFLVKLFILYVTLFL